MFEIAWTEILVIVVIALLVVGPKELPGMLRAFGRTIGTVRRTAREFQTTFNDALREAERQAKLDEVKRDLESVRSIDPTADVRKGLDEAKSALDKKVDDKPAPRPEVVPLKGDRPAAAAPSSVAPATAPAPVTSRPADAPAASPAAPGEGTADERSGEPPRAAASGERR